MNQRPYLAHIPPEKIYRWQTSRWKDVAHHMSSGKYKLIQNEYHYTPISRDPKSATLMALKLLRWRVTGTFIHYCWTCKMVGILWKMVWWFLRKVNSAKWLKAGEQWVIYRIVESLYCIPETDVTLVC